MITQRSSTCSGASRRRGLTLVEMVVSIVLVGVGLVAALNTVGASKVAQFKVGSERQGILLAQDLMTEILGQDYADPALLQSVLDDIASSGSATYTLGLDSFGGDLEGSTGDRSLFDDVDDYDAWSASPPQAKDGSVNAALTGWQRSVAVGWRMPNDPVSSSPFDRGVKNITVTVTHNGALAAELVALKTIGLPQLQGCCFGDGSCEDLRTEVCAAQGGTAQGPKSRCATTDCPTGPVVLFVVNDDTNPSEQEGLRIALIQSWDYQVTLISASAWQSDFDAAVADAVVAYVSGEVDAASLGTKLRDTTIGVVNEEIQLALEDKFGFSSAISTPTSSTGDLVIEDGTHYITSPFGATTIHIIPSGQTVDVLGDPADRRAPDIQDLARMNTRVNLAALETGASLKGGGTAAGRRVLLPWGRDGFDFGGLTPDGRTIMQRSIEWASENIAVSLLFVSAGAVPTAAEQIQVDRIESWGHSVTNINASASQANYDTALADVEVVYVSQLVQSSDVGTKLTDTTVGVVSEEWGLVDELGIAEQTIVQKNTTNFQIIDNTHYVTSGLNLGALALYSSAQPVWIVTGPVAPGLEILGETLDSGSSYFPGLAVLATGADLYGGGFAAGRRVQLPWSGGNAFDYNALNSAGLSMMRRSIEWAAGAGGGGGGGGAVCGDATCDPGEDCNSCAADCPGKSNGPVSGRYCCGDGTPQSAEGDGSICDGNY